MTRDDDQRFDASALSDLSRAALDPTGDESGTQIGPYLLKRCIGAGGMGVVYEAERQHPVRQRVAIKLIRPGMGTGHIVTRFEAERHTLALMDHPNVAKVFDAGADERGRPYFVMEFVDGLPLTRYCDEHGLSTRERLELFLQVCDGVQHAHRKAIIHRDLKPSNVLVANVEGRAVPKIIDFGVAKAIDQPLTEQTLFTQAGAIIGTPEYMSPEQATGDTGDIDTRADVYSLGVLLYELLVGALPFDPETLREAGFDEMRRRIREDEPSRPSARVSDLGRSAHDAARSRGVDSVQLARHLKGDLDWITMKALEKERDRRYDSASAFADDVRRHLDDRPVFAGPPSLAYRGRKFYRRHRVAVVGSIAGLLLTAVAVAGLTVGLIAAVRAEAEARRQAETSEQVLEFVVGLFYMSSEEDGRADMTAREILEVGMSEIDTALAEQPLARAKLMNSMGNVAFGLGLDEQGIALLDGAREIREELLDEGHPDRVYSLWDEGWILDRAGQTERAEAIYVEIVDKLEAMLGPRNADTLEARGDLARLYFNQDRYQDAIDVLEGIPRYDGGGWSERDRQAVRAKHFLGSALGMVGRYDEAEPLLVEAHERYSEHFGRSHRFTLSVLETLPLLYEAQGRPDDHERAQRDLLAGVRELASMNAQDPRPNQRYALMALTVEPESLRDPADALHFAQVAHDLTGGADHGALETLALAHDRLGQHARAIELQRQAIELLPELSPLQEDMESVLASFEANLASATNDD